jgi:hypothetical protein
MNAQRRRRQKNLASHRKSTKSMREDRHRPLPPRLAATAIPPSTTPFADASHMPKLCGNTRVDQSCLDATAPISGRARLASAICRNGNRQQQHLVVLCHLIRSIYEPVPIPKPILLKRWCIGIVYADGFVQLFT